jgi:DNA-directed RNA polymerase subunit RPC12/RpoP
LFYTISGQESSSATVPPRYAFRLDDLRVLYHLVRASCHACGHKAIVPNAALLQGRPGYTRLMSLERQLRCRSCGARGRASLEVEFRPRD